MITENLQCEICSSRPAKLMCLRSKQGDVSRTFVCADCAGEVAGRRAGPSLDLERILSGMERNSAASHSAYSCRLCGTSVAEIVSDGRPGCCMCYLHFTAEIQQAAGLAHGRTRHVGKAPAR